MTERIRIKDIAKRSGVSVGTVDRVLHNRPNVSEPARKKVEKALAEMNYQPNMYASALAYNKSYTFYLVVPQHESEAYWEEIEEYEYPYFYLYDSDRNVLTDWVVISKGASGINSAATDTAAKKHGIYTLDGVRINDKFESLPAGIYIVDGKKTVKK